MMTFVRLRARVEQNKSSVDVDEAELSRDGLLADLR